MTVFVVQEQHRFDTVARKFVPKFDLKPAEEFGALSFLLGPTAAPWNPDSIIPELTQKLQEYRDQDHLLLIGNPILIGWSVAIAADINDGVVNLLQWSGKDQRYISVSAKLFDC